MEAVGTVPADRPNNPHSTFLRNGSPGRIVGAYQELCRRVPLSLRLDVLIYAEQVAGIVPLLDLSQTVVILTVGRPDPILALLHHEVDVGAAGGIGMKRVPILPRPDGDFFLVRGVGIDPDNYRTPHRVPVSPRRGAVLDAAGSSVDRIEVHG